MPGSPVPATMAIDHVINEVQPHSVDRPHSDSPAGTRARPAPSGAAAIVCCPLEGV